MFQDRLQKLREQHGYSVKEAAAALHLPYTTYNNYEKNTREPNGEILCRIAAFFFGKSGLFVRSNQYAF